MFLIVTGQYPMLNTGIGRAVEYRRNIPASTRIRKIHSEGGIISSISLYYRPKQALLVLAVISDTEKLKLESSPPSFEKTSSKEIDDLQNKFSVSLKLNLKVRHFSKTAQ